MTSAWNRAVGRWLMLVALAVVIQVALGGITRLTDSGLSITEWKPILGVIPPTSEAAWVEAFGKYQQIPQFQRLKSHLSLGEFKVIYFWEWFHRLWGRLLGFFFVGPLVYFWRKGAIDGHKGALIGLLALGGAQGVMGWVMVASGLQELVYVSHLRLAVHFVLAAVLLAALVWMGRSFLGVEVRERSAHARTTAVLLAAVVLQLIWGAFMAGLKAALVAPTWPTINGQWIPPALFGSGEWWWNDPLAIHFVHRTLAYLLSAAIGWWWWTVRGALGRSAHVVLAAVIGQTVLGVITVLRSVHQGELLWFGVAHQLLGLGLMVSLVWALRALWGATAVRAAHPSSSTPAISGA